MEHNHIKRDEKMICFRILALCFVVLHYGVAYGVLFCIFQMNGLNCVINSVYLVFCVQHVMAIESLVLHLKPVARKNHGVMGSCRCCCYLVLELMFFLSHCAIVVFFLRFHLQWSMYLLFTIHFVTHCIVSYVSMTRILATGRFMFCDIKG